MSTLNFVIKVIIIQILCNLIDWEILIFNSSSEFLSRLLITVRTVCLILLSSPSIITWPRRKKSLVWPKLWTGSQEGRIQLRKSDTGSVYPCTTRWEGVLVHGLAICSLFTGKCGRTARLTVRHLKLFHKKWKIPNNRLGRWTSFELTEPLKYNWPRKIFLRTWELVVIV